MAQTLKEMAKRNYERGLWTIDMLRALVAKDKVTFTAEDYKEITGEPYNV